MKSHRFVLVWLIFGIPIISYLLLQKTFNLALYGDDWLQLYNLWLSFDVHKTLSFFDIKSYLSSYWPQYFFLGIIRHFFEYEAPAYFAVSLLLRILAIISLFFLVRELSKSYLTAFLATLIFTFSVTGLQTTDWVFNMNTYAGIFFLNLAMVFYLKIRKLKTYLSWHYLTYILFFTLALGVVPVRMHSAVPFVIISELFLYIFIDKKNILKPDIFLIARLALSAAIMLMLVKVGSFVLGGEFPQLAHNLLYLQDTVQKGGYDILFYFLGIIGNMVIPDTTNPAASFNHLLTIIIFFTFVGLAFSFSLKGSRIMYVAILTFNVLWIIVGNLLTLWNPNLSLSSLFAISVGSQSIFLSTIVFFKTYKLHPYLASSIIIALFWMISFTLIYWFRTGFQILESTSRYMTVGAVGFAILLASIITIMFREYTTIPQLSAKTRLIKSISLMVPFLVLISWLNINFQSSQLYFTSLENNRNLALVNKTWNRLKSYVPKLDEGIPSVFYFTYDNSTAAYMVLTFGFWPHAGLVYGIPTMENTPLPTDSYPELLEIIRTGEPLKRIHGRKEIPVSLSRVFAFDFRNGELVPITDQIRQKLTGDLKLKETN
ncbi:MAG: hypothetical protein Q7R43_02345 [Candidatus Daviesbacteria bacterium]|nr:hypothetical protein [Candidatus Daviesbacteria bacterium]